jgi:hypothetical protein
MAEDIPQYIREAFDRLQEIIGGVGGMILEFEPFSQGFQDALARTPRRSNHSSYIVGYTAGASYIPQPSNARPREEPRREEPRRDDRQPPNAGRGRPVHFGLFQQMPSRLE